MTLQKTLQTLEKKAQIIAKKEDCEPMEIYSELLDDENIFLLDGPDFDYSSLEVAINNLKPSHGKSCKVELYTDEKGQVFCKELE